MSRDKAVLEKGPDIAMVGKETPGHEIMQTTGGYPKRKKQQEHGWFETAVPEEPYPSQEITTDDAIKDEQEQVHRLPVLDEGIQFIQIDPRDDLLCKIFDHFVPSFQSHPSFLLR